MVAAVIFDMDGVLIDSEPLWREAEREVFAELGLVLSDADCQQTMGLRTDELVAYWHCRHPWQGRSQPVVADTINSRVARLIAERGTPLPGAVAAVRSAVDSGLPVGLASSSSLELIDLVVRTLGLADGFSVLCSAEDEERGKPDPAVYLTTARRLGVPPAECVAVEDSVRGVQAAVAAGMRVVAVPPPDRFDDPELDLAHLKLRSLEVFSIELLQEKGLGAGI
jgi:sugar-phosphatase